MSENSSWWLLLPCGIVTVALTTAIVVVVVVVRKVARPALRNLTDVRGAGGSSSPLDSNWVPGPATTDTYTQPSSSYSESSHDQWQSHGHTVHHHDSGSSWSDSGSSSWSDSGSSSSGDSGSSSSSDSGSSSSSDSGSSSSSDSD
ncbi:hypothetical protein ACPPVO_51945 [Dactylosporangium sp. McL0621]|uniref:hypothetical protein n=1 Tax=Dactylosporangium sp. McL0621 TaxID=3415678 RepID=UPI003CEEE885